MIFNDTTLKEARVIELQKHGDARGYFARTFCVEEFSDAGLETSFVQHNTSFSAETGTLRGLHFQRPPHSEVKVIRAVRGAVYDVIVDLRSASPTFGQWEGFALTAEAGTMLYVPEGFAHGFQTLEPDTAVAYPSSRAYQPGAEGGVRWDDPGLKIEWPLPVSVISDKDRSWPDLDLTAGGPF